MDRLNDVGTDWLGNTEITLMNTLGLGQQIAVIGMGQTGVSVARYLAARKITITALFDTRELVSDAVHQLARELGANLHLGALATKELAGFDTLIVSPGVAISTPAIAYASKKGAQVIGDVELFARCNERPVIAITGSNGKSTVTDLATEMARACGVKADAVGNIGVPVLDRIDSDTELFVMELSSFQLETTTSLKPDVATILNLCADHLDRYSDFNAYANAKQQVYQQCQTALVNRDDQLTWPVNSHQPIKANVSFGTDAPTNAREWGLITRSDGTWLAQGEHLLMDVQEIRLLGLHNYANALAALALLSEINLPLSPCLDVLKRYEGLAHRCQRVDTHDGVLWVNDSKATNEGATLAALHGLRPQLKGRLILLAGGDGKGAEFTELYDRFQSDVDELICFGQDKAKLAALKRGSQQVVDLEQAVACAKLMAKPGDMVLLSPACASLDQFTNYMVRGDAFVRYAQGGAHG